MYQGQIIMAPFLTVKRNEPMPLSKHEVTRGEGNKETRNDHALPVSRMLWNSLLYSRDILCSEMDIKAGLVL